MLTSSFLMQSLIHVYGKTPRAFAVKYYLLFTIIALMLASHFPIQVLSQAQSSIVYAFVSTDSPIYVRGQELVAEVFVFPQLDVEKTATIKLYFTNLPATIPEMTVTIPPKSRAAFVVFNSTPVKIPDVPDGTYYLKMEVWIDGVKAAEDTVEFWVRGGPPSGVKPLVLFVWHNHQAPNYWPDGTYFANWHIEHMFQDGLRPYYSLDQAYGEPVYPDMGTYYLHYYLLTKYPHVKVNLHYSPSLIYQLYNASMYGFRMFDQRVENYRFISPNDKLAQVIRDFFNGLAELAREGRVYLMTSCFAHTIMGYYIDRYNIPELIRYDIELGAEWTRRVFGVSTDAIWTPEMAFSMKLVPIYSSLGLRITVLDSTYHFPGASGDKGTIYEPYIVRDRDGNSIIVFFRDQGISDANIGFTNNDWTNPRQADRDARALYYAIYDRHAFKSYRYQPVTVIAADGENWILFAPSKANGALFLDRVYRYMESLTLRNIMESGTFRDALQKSPPQRVLNYIPSTSWLGGWGKWTTERGEEHRVVWQAMDRAMALYKGYLYWSGVRSYSDFEERVAKIPEFNQSIIALIHAMDSDFWWAEFFSKTYIDRWLEAFETSLRKLLNINLEVSVEPKPMLAGVENRVYVTLINDNDYPLTDTRIYVAAGDASKTESATIPPKSRYTVVLSTKPKKTGTLSVVIRVYNPGTVVAGQTFYLVEQSRSFTVYKAPDITARVVVTAPNGALAGLQPTPPGEYAFTITVYNSDKTPAGFAIPVNFTLQIAGRTIVESLEIPSDSYYATKIVKVYLDEGVYTYNLTITTSYDADPGNNNVAGTITVSATSGSEGGGLITILLYVAIAAWAALAVVALAKLLVKRR